MTTAREPRKHPTPPTVAPPIAARPPREAPAHEAPAPASLMALQRAAGNRAVAATVAQRETTPDAPLQRQPTATSASTLATADALVAKMQQREELQRTFLREASSTVDVARGWFKDAVVGVYARCYSHFEGFQTRAKVSGDINAAVTGFFSAVNPFAAGGEAMKLVVDANAKLAKADTAAKLAYTTAPKVFGAAPVAPQRNALSALTPASNKSTQAPTEAPDKAPTETKGVPGVGDVAASAYSMLTDFAARQLEIGSKVADVVSPALAAANRYREELRASEKRGSDEEIKALGEELGRLDQAMGEQDILLQGQIDMLRDLRQRCWRPWPADRRVEQDLWILWLSGVYGLRYIADAPFQNENPFDRAVTGHMVDIGVTQRLEANGWPADIASFAPSWYALPGQARVEVAKPEFRRYWNDLLSLAAPASAGSDQ